MGNTRRHRGWASWIFGVSLLGAGISADPGLAQPIVFATKADVLIDDVGGDGDVSPGDTVRYLVVLTNTGNQAATNVTFNDSPDPNTSLISASITSTSGLALGDNGSVEVSNITALAGSSVTITFDVVVDSPFPAGVGSISNQGTATGDNIPSTPTDDPDSVAAGDATVTVVAAPSLGATKVDTLVVDVGGDGMVNPGDTVRYIVVLSNSGSQDVANLVFTDTPGPNTSLVVGTVFTSQGTVTTGNAGGDTSVNVAVGTAAGGGGGATIIFRVLVDNPFPAGVGSISNQGTATGDNIPSTPTDDPDSAAVGDATATVVVASPDLDASKFDDLVVDVGLDGDVSPGDTVRYSIALGNTGNQDAANVVFVDMPDPNTSLVVGSVSTSQGTVITGNAAGDSSVNIAVGTVAGGGNSASIVFRVLVDNPLPAGVGSISNQGTATGDSIPSTPTDDPGSAAAGDATATVVVASPDLGATKADALLVDVGGDGDVSPGDTVEYTVVLTNSGNQDAANVVFTDSPDSDTSLVVGSVTTTQGAVFTGNMGGDTGINVAVGTLAGGGGSATIVFRVLVDNPFPAGVGSISNQGTATGDNIPSTPTDDPGSAAAGDATATAVVAAPDLGATKADALLIDVGGDGDVSHGDTVEYTVVLTNSGNQDAANVVFTDSPDPDTSLVVGSVTTTQGAVVAGNMGGDTSVNIAVGTVAGDGGSVTIAFSVLVNASVGSISNQGTATGDNVPATPTDDPDSAGAGEATTTVVLRRVPTVPTASAWALFALAGALLALGLRAVTRSNGA